MNLKKKEKIFKYYQFIILFAFPYFWNKNQVHSLAMIFLALYIIVLDFIDAHT